MKNMELLAPAGNMDSLKQAVYNGADAVYLGIKQFNARNNIEGFNFDNLAQAVDFAHLFGVKVYLALNILFEDDELQDALDLVVEANNRNVDAFIVQDLGLVYLIKKYYPSIELHASTQMAVHSLEGVRVLEKLGFSRAVLARETSVEEIRRIHENSNIEIEFFVQGALCVSFSGNCYMCSHLVDKSGNRGLCQQFCRLPYTFNAGDVNNRGYLLSAKDICMLDNLNFLSDLGISSLKIEGRARRPFYVAKATQIYRKALNGEKISTKDLDELKIAFNRNYTPAYFKGNGNIISSIQGNNGLEIGEVVKVKNGAKFNEIFISTKYDLKG
ncbi:MAG: U32 family peptidase, partial [Clostridia bacterium]|nr:U32 family peptidase [Clostridia bacterium]